MEDLVIPSISYQFLGRQKLSGNTTDAIASNACGFWATGCSMAVVLGATTFSLPTSAEWIKSWLNDLQKEYRTFGVSRSTVLDGVTALGIAAEELIKSEDIQNLTIVSVDYDSPFGIQATEYLQ